MPEFVHLHCHTEYSLLDGAIRLKDLCQRAKDYGMPAVAITDHGNMYGAVTFYSTALEYGLKPILGCECYVAPGDRRQKTAKSAGEAGHHLVLLAKNLEGYRNLVKLVSKGYLEGFHYKPRIDKELLAKHNSGLTALSACLGGEIPQLLRRKGMDAAIEAARQYAGFFPNDFYLELQDNGIPEQAEMNEKLMELAEATGLPLVATNDCHYLDKDDVEAHDLLLCIQTASQVDSAKRMRFDTGELYFKPPEEMERAFSHCPQALDNVQRIAQECNLQIELGKNHFPVYELPESMTIDEEFRRLCIKGLDKRMELVPYEVDEGLYRKRLDYEMDVIQEMGFPAYFLIVQDFINWAKDQGIPVGPGRGSAAGSIVAWALRITNLDPIPYNLLFERFLNVERISMPDIDVDFCERRRGEVIRYVSEKYGDDSVAQITTFGRMKAKAVVRDVGRALGMTFAETDKIAKLIPDDLKMTIEKALEQEPELRLLVDTDERVAKLMDISKRLEGLNRHASTHAAGVVISDKPMTEYLPLYRGKKDEIVTQYDMKRVEKVGLIKFDFLGLRTMTVIQDCLDIIRDQGKEVPDLDSLPLDDPATYEIFARGDTDGIFQVESSGMRKYLRMLKPNCFEDVIAMLALYRPGPLGSGMVEEFIKRKHGEVRIEYPHPLLEETLKPTYGVIVYQEQVMKTAQVIGNYSLGEGDLLRRAMGKKIAEEMAKQRQRFLEGARENDIPDAKANEIFDLMEEFAKYGFNKSHSAAYALISYYTAYLKAHFPQEFMAALISSELENQDKVFKYINACREMSIDVLQPDVNRSRRRFSISEGNILFGLGGIKNVGSEAITNTLAEREENGPFKDLVDFCSRVNLRKCTKRVIEYLIKSGAMDSMGCTRAGLAAALDKAVAIGQSRARERQSGMISMLDMAGGGKDCSQTPLALEEQEVEEWPDEEKLSLEKEALGFFLSSHPLLAYRHEVERLGVVPLDESKDMPGGAEVKLAVILTSRKEHITKGGDKMAFCQVEDLTGVGEMTMLPKAYQESREILDQDQPILVQAKVDARDRSGQEEGPRQAKFLAEKVSLLSEARADETLPVNLGFPAALMENGDGHLDRLRDIITRHPGEAPVKMSLNLGHSVVTMMLGPDFRIWPNPEFWKEIEAWQQGLV